MSRLCGSISMIVCVSCVSNLWMTTESLPGNNLCISNDEMLKIVGKQMFTKNKKYLNHLV